MSEKEKNAKGLRHFSLRVCEKVKNKGTTTYNEVADELVEEQQRAEVQLKKKKKKKKRKKKKKKKKEKEEEEEEEKKKK